MKKLPGIGRCNTLYDVSFDRGIVTSNCVLEQCFLAMLDEIAERYAISRIWQIALRN